MIKHTEKDYNFICKETTIKNNTFSTVNQLKKKFVCLKSNNFKYKSATSKKQTGWRQMQPPPHEACLGFNV